MRHPTLALICNTTKKTCPSRQFWLNFQTCSQSPCCIGYPLSWRLRKNNGTVGKQVLFLSQVNMFSTCMSNFESGKIEIEPVLASWNNLKCRPTKNCNGINIWANNVFSWSFCWQYYICLLCLFVSYLKNINQKMHPSMWEGETPNLLLLGVFKWFAMKMVDIRISAFLGPENILFSKLFENLWSDSNGNQTNLKKIQPTNCVRAKSHPQILIS